MENKLLLSIIIPVYNVEKYLEKCISSLYSQNVARSLYEVIAVEDCSTDQSLNLLIKLAEKYHGLKIIQQKENQKQGSARNVGLLKATGEYVWFVDSDDYIEENCLVEIFDTLNRYKDVEAIHFDYKEFNGKKEIPYRVNYELDVKTGSEFLQDENDLWWQKGIEVWRRVHKRKFLLDNKLLFVENLMFEDADYSLLMMDKIKQIKHIDISPYIYRNNPASITKRKVNENHFYFWINLCLRLVNNKKLIKDEYIKKITDELVNYQLSLSLSAFWELSILQKYKAIKLCENIDVSPLSESMLSRRWKITKRIVF